ncbi:MAG TPA: PQQ-binding-like beta-propeller repeat protein, partial [Acetobacteraceae bacterium]|nr:PQQ-binding-like beta-propeller repeat protein [Acetobacteraceae bacterium]
DTHAYDVRTGELKWVFHSVPEKGEFGADTWPEAALASGGGVHNWSELTVDEARGIAYIPFGTARFDFYGGNRIGDNLFGNSLVALDARTGKRLWHYQLIHHDLWDYDIPQSAKLLTIRQNGRDRQIVAQATKHGFLFVFDRKTGEPIWPIVEKPVPQTDVPGEWTSPTQPFPSKPEPYAQQKFTEKDINPYLPKETQDALRQQMKGYRNEGLFTPPSIEGTIEMPGHNGGANFGTSAVDPTKGEFYVVHKSLPVLTRIYLPRAPRGAGAGPGAAGGGGGRGGGGAAGGGGRGAGAAGGGVCGDNGPVSPEQKAMLTAQAKELIANANGQRVEFDSPVAFMNCNFPGGTMTAVKPPWSELVKYDLNTGDVKWRIPVGVQEAPPEFGIPKTTGVQFPRDAPVVTAGGLIFLGAGPEKKVHAYDRDSGKELWQFALENGTEGMPAVYEVNGKQFVVFPVAQPTGTFPASFTNTAAPAPIAAAGGGRAAAGPGLPPGQANAALAAGAAPEAAAVAAAAGAQGGRGGRGGRGGGGPQLPSAYIAFALP